MSIDDICKELDEIEDILRNPKGLSLEQINILMENRGKLLYIINDSIIGETDGN